LVHSSVNGEPGGTPETDLFEGLDL
jgi:hypothetical protein